MKCPKCSGDGYTAEHDLPSRHGEYGECVSCPVQVECERCYGTGREIIEAINKLGADGNEKE